MKTLCRFIAAIALSASFAAGAQEARISHYSGEPAD